MILCIKIIAVIGTSPKLHLETNPDDLISNSLSPQAPSRSLSNKTIFESYRAIGINRLSIGIQSFFEDDLKSMNRAHNSEEAKTCLELATQYFDNITIDLIYGIPNMSLEKWNENLEIAFSYGVNHISSYALTIEPKTALDIFIKKGEYPPIDETLALEHFNHLIDKTKEQGFVHYEISNFGKPNYFSKHNTSYWQGKPYIGIGPSAHSFNGNQRSWNVSNNSKYIRSFQSNALPNTVEILSEKDQYNEYIMTGLRTIWGVSLNKIENDFGESFTEHLKASSGKFIESGLLVTSSDLDENQNRTETLKTTQKGKFLVDGIASELFILN